MDRMPEPMTIAQLPAEMRPREKLLKHGASALTDTELLDRFKGFAGLIHASAAELKTFKGLGGDAKRSQLVAVLEMARRALTQQLTETTVMNSPNAVKQYLQLELAQLKHEVFAVLFLDAHNRLLSYQPMFRGSLSQTMVYPREVAKTALALGADGVVLAHNHPGGTVKPSQADMKLTRTLQEALALIDVTVRDHIIVAQGKYLSMAEEGLL
jgi:DNA repair protein RadC